MRVTISWSEIRTTKKTLDVSAEWLAEQLEIDGWRKMTPDELWGAIMEVYNDTNKVEDLLRGVGDKIIITDLGGNEYFEFDDITWQVRRGGST